MQQEAGWNTRWIGAGLMVVIHGAALWGLWQHRLIPSPVEVSTLFVNFIAPPMPKQAEPPKREPPRPRPVEKPRPRQLVATAPVVAPDEHVAPPPAAPSIEAVPAPPPPKPAAPAGPVNLGAELSVACPERSPPAYPALSRRMGESGTVVLRVELDEQGQVALARVDSGSGFERLDQAALAAVKTWRCQPPRRNGEPVRAVARQPFNFVLQGN